MLDVSERLARCCRWVLYHPNFQDALEGDFEPKLRVVADRLVEFANRSLDEAYLGNGFDQSNGDFTWLISRLPAVERIFVEYWNAQLVKLACPETIEEPEPKPEKIPQLQNLQIAPIPAEAPELADEWKNLSAYIKGLPDLYSIPLNTDGLPYRAKKWISSLAHPTLGEVFEHDFEVVFRLRNFGARSIRAIVDLTRRTIVNLAERPDSLSEEKNDSKRIPEIAPLPRKAKKLKEEWGRLREYVDGSPALHSVELQTRKLPHRAIRWVEALEQSTLLAILEHDFESVVAQRNFGLGSTRAIADAVRKTIVQVASKPDFIADVISDSPKPIPVGIDWSKWAAAFLLPIGVSSLGKRACGYLESVEKCIFLGDAVLTVVGDLKFEEQAGFGRKSANEILDLRRCVRAGDQEFFGWLVGSDEPPATFPQAIDRWLEELDSVDKDIVIDKIALGATLEQVAKNNGLTRERVRQRMTRLRDYVVRGIAAYQIDLDAVLEDDLIEIEELGGIDGAAQPPSLYIRLVRFVLLPGNSSYGVDKIYKGALRDFGSALTDNPDWLLGKLTRDGVLRLASDFGGPLGEVDELDIVDGAPKYSRSMWTHDWRLVPRVFNSKAILRHFVRRAGGEHNAETLCLLLESVADLYGVDLEFDVPTIRRIVRGMDDLWLRPGDIVSERQLDAVVLEAWIDQFVGFISEKGHPVSVASFLEEFPDAPFDVMAFTDALDRSEQCVKVGRFLYFNDDLGDKSELAISHLIREALELSDQPLTKHDILQFIRSKRDLRTSQLDGYFTRVKGLVSYGNYAFALGPIDRDGKISLIQNEGFVRARFKSFRGRLRVELGEFWPTELGHVPALSLEEAHSCVQEARAWKAFRLEFEESLVFRRERTGRRAISGEKRR